MTDPSSAVGGGDPADSTTLDEKRRDQLLRAEGSTETDAAPRIEVTKHDGVTRIDIAEDAAVRPGLGPGVGPATDVAGPDDRTQGAG